MSKRAKNPRREVVEWLRTSKKYLESAMAPWTDAGKVYVPPDERPGQHGPNAWLRKRRPDEYPETQIDEWVRLSEQMMMLSNALRRVASFADAQADRLDREALTTEEGKP